MGHRLKCTPPPSLPPGPQDESAASHAAKLSREEAALDFSQPAAACHNKVRGFAGWPATFATFQQRGADGGDLGPLELKVVRTALGSPACWSGSSERQVATTCDALLIRCGDGSVLKVGPRCGRGRRPACCMAVLLQGQLSLALPIAAPAAWAPPVQVLQVQAPGKRVVAARDFINGLKGRTLLWQPVQQPAGVAA